MMPLKKKTTTTPKAKVKTSTNSTKKLPIKRKKLTLEELHPFSSFPYRLEHQDGTERKICHFECEEHRNKYIKRYGLKKRNYVIDSLT